MPGPCLPPDGPAAAIARWGPLVRPGGEVLDVAAGGGRHAQWFARRGHAVLAVDRDTTALQALAMAGVTVLTADLEGTAWPLSGRTFAAVVVVNYLWRPRLPELIASVAPGGLLLYETFAQGHERFGRPRNPEFLLRPGELPAAVRGALDVVAFWQGEVGDPPTAVRQGLVARRSAAADHSRSGS